MSGVPGVLYQHAQISNQRLSCLQGIAASQRVPLVRVLPGRLHLAVHFIAFISYATMPDTLMCGGWLAVFVCVVAAGVVVFAQTIALLTQNTCKQALPGFGVKGMMGDCVRCEGALRVCAGTTELGQL